MCADVAFMRVCAPCACLVPVGARRECHLDLESQTVVSYSVVLGDSTWVLCKSV